MGTINKAIFFNNENETFFPNINFSIKLQIVKATSRVKGKKNK